MNINNDRLWQIEGLRELNQMIEDMTKIPNKVLSTATKQAARIALDDAKRNAPKKTGILKRSLRLKAERSKKNRKVWQVQTNPKYDERFVVIREKNGNVTSRGFYPNSMEYGFKKKGGGKRPGLHFMKLAIDNNDTAIMQKIVDVLREEIDKLE